MARKRSKTKRTTHRRRARVSGLNVGDAQSTLLNHVLPIAVGYYAADKIVDMLPASVSTYSKWVKLAGGVIGAIAIKNPMAQSALIGVAASGATDVINDAVAPAANGLGLLMPGTGYGNRILNGLGDISEAKQL